MSVTVMGVVWKANLPATEKIVLLKLADHANDEGENAYPSVGTLADTCGLTRRGVQKILERLREQRWIEVQADHTNRRSTVYRIVLDPASRSERRSPQTETLEVNDVRPPCEPRSPLEANVVPIGGEPGSPEPSVNRPTTITRTTRARDGRRPHPLDEPPRLSETQLAWLNRLIEAYPRHDEGLHQATAEWIALEPDEALFRVILADIERRVSLGWGVGDELRFVPFLGKYLAQRSWQERFVAPRKPAKDPAHEPAGPRVPDAGQTAAYLASLRSTP